MHSSLMRIYAGWPFRSAAIERTELVWDPRDAWRPVPLRAPYLLTLAGLLLLTAIALEVCRQYNDRIGWLVRYKHASDLPTTVSVAYVIVPTAIALVVVNLWEFSSCDVMRLEPYFQLAKSRGASATVLFTNYSFCYGIFAPITAARNRHWIALCVSLMSLVIRMLLPSLFAGMIVMGELNLTDPKIIETWPALVDLQTQEGWMAAETSGLSESSQDAEFLSLRSPHYAAAPVSMPVDDENDTSMLRLNQTIYWANLTCVDMPLYGIVPTTHSMNYTSSDDEQTISWNMRNISLPTLSDSTAGCSINFALDSVAPTDTERFQLGYWEPSQPSRNSNTTSAFTGSGCGSPTLYGVVIEGDVLKNNSIKPSKAAAFAYMATYHYAEAEVFIATNTSIVAAQIQQDTVSSLSPAEFSIDKFEDQFRVGPRAAGIRIIVNTTSSSSLFDTGSTSKFIALEEYQKKLRNSWNHRFLVTVNKMFDPTRPTKTHAEQQSVSVILQMLHDPAIHAEIILCVASLLLSFLAFVYPRRPNFLRSDPGSIAAQCAIVANLFSPTIALARPDTDFDQATTRQLLQWAKGLWCQWSGVSKERRLEIVSLDGNPVPLATGKSRRKKDFMPHFLRLPLFFMECLSLAFVLALFGLALRYLRMDEPNSMTGPQLVLYVSMLFVPTIVASMISALLASVLRHLSVLEPWTQLQKGLATAKQSLLMDYGCQTSFAVLWKCARRGPRLLVIISLACILDLLLTVVSGGLFEPQVRHYSTAASGLFATYNLSTLSRQSQSPVLDSYSVIPSAITQDAPFLPWTTSNHSLVPIRIDGPESERTFYTALTRGIGVNLICESLPSSDSGIDGNSTNPYWRYTPFNSSTESACSVEAPWAASDYPENFIHFMAPTGSSASTECETSTLLVIARLDKTTGRSLHRDITFALHCQPTIHIQDFLVQFDHSGQVEDYEAVPGSSITDGPLYQNASDLLGQFNMAFTQSIQALPAHPNSSFYQYDWPGILTARTIEKLNPKSDSVDTALLIDAVQLTYRTVFSTYLTLWRDLYLQRLPESHSITIDRTVTQGVWGILPSTPSILIVIILVSLDVVLMVGVFVTYHGRFNGPRIPKSIGSLIPWIAHSQMMRDFEGTHAWSEVQQREHLEELDRTYSLGTFPCPDGMSRIAVDYKDDEQAYELHDLATSGAVPSGSTAQEPQHGYQGVSRTPQGGPVDTICTDRRPNSMGYV
ncbi:alcohol dehydrogenase [Aspergillus flavus]|nr:alcohol dehydrogenase [Aspergillus flavus]